MLFLLACASEDKDTSSDPGDAWVQTRLYAAPFAAAGAERVVGGYGRVLAVGDPWTDLGGETLSDGVRVARARGGAVWAMTTGELFGWDGTAWQSVGFPAGWGVAEEMAVLADGSVALLHPHEDCDDCEVSVVSDDLAIWDGSAWTTYTPPIVDTWLTGLAELDDGTLVASGSGGEIAAWTGSEWAITEVGTTRLEDIAASGDEVVAVGAGGLVVTGPLDALTVESAGTDDLAEVDVADGVAWALGATSAWVRDGSWTAVALPEGEWHDIAAVDGGAIVVGDDLGPVGLVGDADGWTEAWRESSASVNPTWVDEDGAAWIAEGTWVARWDGSTITGWRVDGAAEHIDGSGPDDVVAVGEETIVAWDGSDWSTFDVGEDTYLWDVAVAPDGAAFAVGSARDDAEDEWPVLWRRTSAGWTEETAEIPGSARALIAVTAFAEDDVYAVTWGGEAALLHWDGAAWTDLTGDLGAAFQALWGRSGDDLYLGGDALVHWDGTAATAVSGGPFGVDDLAGDDDVLYVAGTDGYGDDYAPVTMEYRDGAWTELFRADQRMAVGASDAAAVVLGDAYGWRRE